MENERGTVERIVRLIAFLASQDDDVGVKDIADELQLPHSTAHRLLQQLVALNLMQRVQGARRYAFGPEMYRLGAMISNKVNVVQLASTPLHRIVAYTNESCALALYRDQDATLVFAKQVESANQLRYQLDLYRPVSVLWGASGHAVLAHLPPERVRTLLKKEPLSPTGLAALPARELNRDLKQIREQGYSVSTRGEKIEGAAGISTPIFGTGGHVIGCFSLFIPRIRYPEHRETELAQLLVREAGALSDVLAGRQAAPAGAPGAAR
ncbi:transcriptional regulator, IclR family, C-terminal domain protein [Bordetella bronchiseptica MBORD675]|uniref:IclR family transcriptional regulator n=1 Tax=Bordetella bronchiseptica TaxID=518 RepID=UPI00028F9707|nr:IclR family transcriptional regulator [Bordetella bronchiseptica]KDC14511.1 transcriptional regulator, IclR family, C-terminal domain protein [Bordetella bronchiseptica F-1]KDC23254.1 transcriptional regulator, IclR family, C-terminal domain protein [Bordetella bronchiseptica F2]KDC92561.1 transcriptional regulator, IclR family, C-terminal domain protein [Bordetella bronchiseptica MBORD675]QET70858.1 IclR family transcriptional regulator [Bordetella bronchiseptica]QIX99788.1 IclR family tra